MDIQSQHRMPGKMEKSNSNNEKRNNYFFIKYIKAIIKSLTCCLSRYSQTISVIESHNVLLHSLCKSYSQYYN